MRKHLTWTLPLALALVAGVSAAALAAGDKPVTVRVGNLVLRLNGGISPKALSKTRLSPISIHAKGSIATNDGSQPPALKEFIADIGPSGEVDAKDFPSCRLGQLEATTTPRAEAACRGAIVGKGKAGVRVAFPESSPFDAAGPLVIFNGGEKGGVTTLFMHAYLSVPAPTAVVAVAKMEKEHKGPYTMHWVASVPVIAGGSGSVTSFEFLIDRHGYVLERCSEGELLVDGTAKFRDGTEASGKFNRPCIGIG
jgi:hypothetical protein